MRTWKRVVALQRVHLHPFSGKPTHHGKSVCTQPDNNRWSPPSINATDRYQRHRLTHLLRFIPPITLATPLTRD